MKVFSSLFFLMIRLPKILMIIYFDYQLHSTSLISVPKSFVFSYKILSGCSKYVQNLVFTFIFSFH